MIMAPYNPPTRVRTIEVPFKVMVLRADPNFEVDKRKEPFYEFTGRRFSGDTSRSGAYAPDND